ncbi:LysR family transcriptional regulator [Thalassococcus sp. CAU 1522]|uniref:LysR family transcriptional regulator n=1 Tax=Thalassococcus arenae TaxID=2851652 RepID=A0ABS6N3S8_9RHOB|nr:LysR family transcriptional regulator [Thalassococcus arenae]MBV2358155.1 LysR family transcriptional regulator [Thalassococcus arenae]
MQIELIDTFLDLCETRSFNRTAERLGVTQSTVSGRIKALERAVGESLLSRSRAGTELTTAGMRFAPHARHVRLLWTEALHATRQRDGGALTMRIAIQHDLMENHIADWITALRDSLPGSAFYVEADYSVQMCRDMVSGDLDLGILFTPSGHPDLHFESLGEVVYRMVSTDTDTLVGVKGNRYILPNYSPAFAHSHAELLPRLSRGAVSSGQGGVIRGLLSALGGSTYLLDETARALVASGEARFVSDAPRIAQSVYAGAHLRYRHRPAYRRMIRVLRGQVRSDTG